MRKKGFIFFLSLFLFINSLFADIIGVNDYPFGAPQLDLTNQYVAPFLSLAMGFSVNDGVASLETSQPVGGKIIFIGERPVLELEKDLVLGSNCTFSFHNYKGYISGNNYSILLNNDLEIAPKDDYGQTYSASLIFLSDTIINGNGKSLILTDSSQLIVDSNVTVTFQNLKLIFHYNSESEPPIKMYCDAGVCLKNCEVILGSKFCFVGGNLFIAGKTGIKGPYEFQYSSTHDCYILPNATLILGKGDGKEDTVGDDTEFDTIFTYSPLSPNRDLINLCNKKSKIDVQGCTLQTTFTGMRLTKGILNFHDTSIMRVLPTNVSVSTGVNYLNNLTFPTQRWDLNIFSNHKVLCSAWSADSRLLFIGGAADPNPSPPYNTGYILRVMSDGSYTVISSIPFGGASLHPDTKAITADFAGDGKFLAVGGYADTGRQMSIFPLGADGVAAPSASDLVSTTTVRAVKWSPRIDYSNRRILAVGLGSDETNPLQIVRVSSSGVIFQTIPVASYTGEVQSLAWDPTGEFLAVSGHLGVYIYKVLIDGTAILWQQPFTKAYSAGDVVGSVKWSKDGKYLILGADKDRLGGTVYRMQNGFATSVVASFNSSPTGGMVEAEWMGNHRYMVIGGRDPNSSKQIIVYRFENNSLQTTSEVYSYTVTSTMIVSPDNRFLAMISQDLVNEVSLFSLYPVWKDLRSVTFTAGNVLDTSNPSPYDNCFTFGNSSLGASYNLNFIVRNAVIHLFGHLFVDEA